MAKRFTETTKWQDPWYRGMSPLARSVWSFLLDQCDNAGVWKKDIAGLSFFMSQEINEHEVLKEINKDKERVVVLNCGGKWFIPQFIPFQYGIKPLSDACKTHQQVLELLAKHKIDKMIEKGYVKGIQRVYHTLPDTDTVSTNKYSNLIIDIVNYWNSTSLPKIITISKKRSTHLKERLKSKHFRDNWKDAIDKAWASDFCHGRGAGRGWKISVDWFIDNDNNYVKILEGKYDNKEVDPLEKY